MRRPLALLLTMWLAFGLTTGSALAQNKNKDPDAIGNRDVGSGINFYSLEKEIALGKGLGAGSGTAGQDHRRSEHRRIR